MQYCRQNPINYFYIIRYTNGARICCITNSAITILYTCNAGKQTQRLFKCIFLTLVILNHAADKENSRTEPIFNVDSLQFRNLILPSKLGNKKVY